MNQESKWTVPHRCFQVLLLVVALLILSLICLQDGALSNCSSKTDDIRLKEEIHIDSIDPFDKPVDAFTQKEGQRIATWKTISNKLCPAMIPQSTKYARHLFHLAQLEILKRYDASEESRITPTNCTALWEQKNASGTEFAVRFFEHHGGWEAFSHLDKGSSEIFSFLSIWKCANMQVRMFHDQIFNDHSPIEFGNRLQTYSKKEYIQKRNKKKGEKKLTDCIVAVIRDPISHFLSGYNEIEYRVNVELQDPREAIAKEWPFGSHLVGSMDRFEQFVADLVTCPIGSNLPGIVEDLPNNLEMEHVYSMSSILRLIDKDPHIDKSDINFHYLPSLANLNEIWGPFVLFSCPRSFSNDTKTKFATFPMISDSVKHDSSDDPIGTYKAAKMVMKKEGPVAKALCALHMMDYACWQNLPDGVPKVCMDLYLDYHDGNLLL